MQIPPRQFLNFPQAVAGSAHPTAALPLISVVLPVYNQATHLPESVNSVLSQTDCNLQLIVVNDGSSDDVATALASFLGDERLYVINQQNQGLSAALNRGFGESRGNFLTWTSADNIYLPGALSTLGRFLHANPAVGMCFANVQLIGEAGEILRNSSYRKQEQAREDSSVLLLPIDGNLISEIPDNFINACFLYRREIYTAIGDYNPLLRGVEDYDYWLRISSVARIQHVDIDTPLYQYRLHNNTLTAAISSKSLAVQTETILSQYRASMHSERLATPRQVAPLSKSILTPYLTTGVPALLRRARSSDFGSVVATEADPGRILVILHDYNSRGAADCKIIAEVVSKLPQIIFALLAGTPQMREIADAVNRQLTRNDNLRILDLSSEHQQSLETAFLPDPFIRALMFSLSSVGCVLFVESESPSIASMSALCEWSAVAAAAGRAIVWLTKSDRENNFSRYQDAMFETNATPLRTQLRQMPHLTTIEYSLERDVISALRVIIDKVGLTPPDQGVLDRWLEGLRTAEAR